MKEFDRSDPVVWMEWIRTCNLDHEFRESLEAAYAAGREAGREEAKRSRLDYEDEALAEARRLYEDKEDWQGAVIFLSTVFGRTRELTDAEEEWAKGIVSSRHLRAEEQTHE